MIIKRILLLLALVPCLCGALWQVNGDMVATTMYVGGDVNASSSADYAPATAYIKWGTGASGGSGDYAKIIIYDSSGDIISNSTSAPIQWVSGSVESGTFTSAPALTAGNTYYVGVICNNAFTVWTDGGSDTMMDDWTSSYSSPPTSIDLDDPKYNAQFYIKICNADGDVLLGISNLTSGGSSENGIGGSTELFYYEDGYTCATL